MEVSGKELNDVPHVSSCLLETASGKKASMENPDVNIFFRKRYLFAILLCIGQAFAMILRMNLSIAVVEMTSDKNITVNNRTYLQKAEFNWDSQTKGFVLSVFSFGYFFGPLGGLLALKYGAVRMYAVGVGLAAILTIFSPFFIRFNFYLYIFVRFLEGIFDNLPIACLPQIYTRWAPPNERTRLLLSTTVGVLISGVINHPFCGFLAYHYGWDYLFYVTGGMSLIWCISFLVLTSNEPTTDILMTKKERNYFKSQVPPYIKQKKVTYPWRHLLTSKPFYAYVNENFTFFWAQSFLMFCMPLYVKDMFDFNVQNIGIISGIPALGGVVGISVSAYLSDYLRSRGISIPLLHRIFITLGQLSCVICFIYIGLWANFVESIIALALARILMSFAETSYLILVIDLFYEYSGVAKGFGLIAVGAAFLLNPNVMGYIVADHSRTSWNYYFLFLSIFNIWSIIIFYLYGSGELQEWAAPKIEEDMKPRKSDEKSSDHQ